MVIPSSALVGGRRLGILGWSHVQASSLHQKDLAFFLDRVLPRDKILAGEWRLLVLLDAGRDVAADRVQTKDLIKCGLYCKHIQI